MVYSSGGVCMIPSLLLNGTILAVLLIAAYIVSPYMLLGMLIVVLGVFFKRRNMV